MKSMQEREREEIPADDPEPPQAERTGVWRVLLNSILVAVALLAIVAYFAYS